MSPYELLVENETPVLISESARMLLEKVIDRYVDEDMKNPKVRQQMLDAIARTYPRQAAKFRKPA